MFKSPLFNIKNAVYISVSEEEFLLPSQCFPQPPLQLLLLIKLTCAHFLPLVLFLTWALLSFAYCFYYPGKKPAEILKLYLQLPVKGQYSHYANGSGLWRPQLHPWLLG